MSGTRSRSSSNIVGTNVVLTDNTNHNSVTFPSNSKGSSSSINEFSTNDWRKLMSQGAIIVGPMEMGKGSRREGTGSLTQVFSRFGIDQVYSGDFAGAIRNAVAVPLYTPAGLAMKAKVRGEAVVKAMAKANSGDTLVGESLNDLQATIGMLRRPFQSSLKLLWKTMVKRRKHLDRIGDVTKASANAWLETRYGWKPLLMDIETIISQACIAQARLQRRLVFRGTSMASLSSEGDFFVRLNGPLSGIRGSGSWQRSENYKASAGVIVDVKPMTMFETIEKMLGFRGRDIPSTLWAITPFSFVADWFINVEEWLQAVVPDPHVSVRGSWVTEVSNSISSINEGVLIGDPLYPGLDSETFGSYSDDLVKQLLVTREANPVVPFTPSWTNKTLSFTHTVDALALSAGSVNQMLSKLKH